MKRLLVSMLLVGAVGCGESEQLDPNQEANRLFVEAVQLIESAESKSDEEALRDYEDALSNVQRIIDDYSTSDLAVKLISNETLFTGSTLADIKTRVADLKKRVKANTYLSISFDQLQPSEAEKSAQILIPPAAFEYNGKKIVIQGYVHPGVSSFGEVRSFVLVADNGVCCFGGQPPLHHMIEVTLEDPLRIQYSTQKRKLWGEFTLSDMQHTAVGTLFSGRQLQGGYYKLHAVRLE